MSTDQLGVSPEDPAAKALARRREGSLRRLGKALRLSVTKSGRRDSSFPDYGLFAVWDDKTDKLISPANDYFEHTLTLDQLERFLSTLVRVRCTNGPTDNADDEDDGYDD
ncbi:hypothetical protein ABZU78_29360 [Rhodococcus erythropolis]|uniref:hypothetical protein n=1 Tax=Rhodococcus erythropolis TaxID=1833 RepID=UPI0033A0C6C0